MGSNPTRGTHRTCRYICDVDLGHLGVLNWLAIAVATLAYFALGGVWFLPGMFGKAWSRSMGWDMPEGAEGPGAAIYIGPLLTSLVASIALALLAEATRADGAGDGLILGLVVGLGIAGSVLLLTAVFDPKKPEPRTWFAITGGYHIAGLTLASVIISAWR